MIRSVAPSPLARLARLALFAPLDMLYPARPLSGQTLSPLKVLGQYQQFVWQEQHGLPQNTVQALVRTRDGYLWLGTLAGAESLS
ncbi:MAG: hypothetical protein HY269_09330 [Deltaproteobacteria bacterium]|nr:hypothetical protein [Deltaproteobacteria bacterium]